METCDVVVIGAGLAGAATAYHLTRLGVGKVLLLEQEPMAGMHSSGRNAAMARQSDVPEPIAPLAQEAVRFLTAPPDDLETPTLVRACGLLLLAEGERAEGMRSAGPWLERSEVERRVPVTQGGAFEGALWGPEEGVVDVARLLQAFIAAGSRRGVRLLTAHRANAIHVDRGRVVGVEAGGRRIATAAVVNAAGAWAAAVGGLAAACPVPLRACRRHLFATGPLSWVERDWPIVWDVSHDFYFRPEPPGLLLSPCDESEQRPGVPTVDPGAASLLAGKLGRFMPGLGDLPLARSWAGLRVLTPDGRFVLGRDPRVEGLVWCAGLGGHGMTTSAAVGRVAAEAVLGHDGPPAHSPTRFLREETEPPLDAPGA